MPVKVENKSFNQTIRNRLVTSFMLIFLTITLYGLYISDATQQIHHSLITTQALDEQYSLLWNLKYDNRLITGKTRGILFNVNNRERLHREYSLAITEYDDASERLVASFKEQNELGRLSEINALASQLRGSESRMFDAISKNNTVVALDILNGTYQVQSDQYLDLVERFLQDRNSAITNSVISLRERSLNIDLVSFVILALILILIMIVFLVINRRIIQPIQALSIVTKSFSEGNFAVRANVGLSDELGELITTFNDMGQKLQARTADLELAKQNLEADVKRRTEELEAKLKELEKFNRFVIGRELKMVELKQELKTLRAKVMHDA
jgi:nitrate/nitrite-specific signal transduction histidine kinase